MLQVLLTPRNIFIGNLALSNLLLCIFTMPLTLADLLTKYWPLGKDMVRILLFTSSKFSHHNQVNVCKLMGSLQSSSVFFSSFSILLIAIDRYFILLRPRHKQISSKQVFAIIQ